MTAKTIAVVGAGPGGLCAAMLLASRGFSVTVLEKRDAIGGRSGRLELGPYTFDLGSTMLMMRFLLDEMFELAGTRLQDELELVSLDPMYRLVFKGRALDVFSNPARMKAELRRFAPGSEAGLERFLSREQTRLEHLYPVLQKSWSSLGDLLDPSVVAALPHVGIGRSLYDVAADYFDDEALRLGFSFQSAYLGMSPWECPGGFGMVPYVEHAWGLDYVRGGIHRVCEAMARVAQRNGARIRTGCEVRRLVVEHDRCVAVELADGERIAADQFVVDADATAALLGLLDRDVSLRFRRSRLEHLRESCSTFMMYLGIDAPLPLAHHTFFFADDYRAEMDRVFHHGTLADDLSLYVCNPVVSDPAVAPQGHSALYLLALVPNTSAPIDWTRAAPITRARVLRTFLRRTGIELEPLIRAEHNLTPDDWERQFRISHGAVFGPAHSIDQLLSFRVPNVPPHPKNLFLAGGGTSPGSGLPTILESARIATRLVCARNGVTLPEPRPLPEPRVFGHSGESAMEHAS